MPARLSLAPSVNRISLPILTLAASLPLAAPSAAQGFTQGDLYLATPAATGISTGQGGIVHIDVVAGTTTLLAGPLGYQSYHGMFAYDPYRDRLVFPAYGPDPINDPLRMWAMDATGAMQILADLSASYAAFAPTGDGRIYMRRVQSPNGQVALFDAANQFHTVMDASGTQPFTFVPGAFVQYQHLLYHEPTNSLFMAARHANPSCNTSFTQALTVFRAPLSADGMRVVGPVTCSEFEVSTSGEVPVGLSRMPDGDLLLVCDTNNSGPESRMIRVNPFTLAMTSFAINDYLGAASTNAGSFSSVLNRAVILNTGGDELRAFSAGESGEGIVLPSGPQWVSPAGSTGEIATMIEINRVPCSGSLSLYGDALAGTGGYAPTMTGTGCPEIGGNITLHVGNGLGGETGALLIGFNSLALPLFGGTLHVNPAFSVPLTLGGAPGQGGAGTLAIPLALGPAPLAQWYFQAAVLDSGAPQSLALSNGLDMSL